MRVITADGEIVLGEVEATPTISLTDYSRRETDEFGVTTVVKRDFSRRMSVRLVIPHDDVDDVQRQLAALRATEAQWIADDRYAWLSATGFFRDFEIDVRGRPLSWCRLDVEGLAESEPGADSGGDPAPNDMQSTLRLLAPVAVTDDVLTYSTVDEFDHPQWAAGVIYSAGARVLRLLNHRIYESVAGGNIGHDPVTAFDHWIDIGPTNRWAMFDQALGSLTEDPGPISVVLDVADVNAVALLDVTGASVWVQAPGYDQTLAVAGGTVSFLDLPLTTGPISVTVQGPGTVSVGTLMVGRLVPLGLTTVSPTAGIIDYSRKETDDFGDVTIVERAWAKRMAVDAVIRTDAIDNVANRIAAVRAQPCLWIGDDGLDSLKVYGFFNDFSIERGPTISSLKLSIEGLSQAAARGGGLSANWPDVIDSDPVNHPKPQDGATVGAPPGTPIGDRPVETVLSAIDAAETQISALESLAATLRADADALTASVSGLYDDVLATATDIATLESTVSTHASSISTLSSAVSGLTGSYATLNTKVSAGARNLLKNGGFENGLANWSILSGSWVVLAGLNTWGAYVETFSTGAGSYVAIRSDPVRVDPNLPYTLSADVSFFGATSGNCYIEAVFLDADGAVIPGSYSNVSNPLGNGFSFDLDGRAQVTMTSPANAQSALISLVGYDLTGAPHMAFREIKFENAAYMSSFSQEASVIQTFSALSTLDTQYASLSSTVSTQASSIATNATAITNLNTSVATLSSRVSAGSINLLKNSSFENGLADWYYDGGWGTGVSQFGYAAYFGGVGATVKGLGADVQVYADTWYTFSADMGHGGGDGFFVMNAQWFDASDGWLGETPFVAKTPGQWFTTDQDGRIRDSAQSPPGAAKLRLVFTARAYSGTINVGARQAKVEMGTQMSAWTQEASVFQQAQAISNSEGQIASLSSTVSTQGSAITTNATAISTTTSNLASLSSSVTTLGSTVSSHSTALTTLDSNYASLSSTVSAQGSSVTSNSMAISSVNGLLAARYGIVIEAGTGIARMTGMSTGATSSWKFESDEFEITSASGGARTVYSGGNWRVYDGAGTLRVRMGGVVMAIGLELYRPGFVQQFTPANRPSRILRTMEINTSNSSLSGGTYSGSVAVPEKSLGATLFAYLPWLGSDVPFTGRVRWDSDTVYWDWFASSYLPQILTIGEAGI